jgi:CDGSH-type Zn-finger protein
MSEVSIRIRDNGPLVVEGTVRVTDAEGTVYTIAPGKPSIALCRCGMSANKPFCDGAHKTGFDSVCRVPKPQ